MVLKKKKAAARDEEVYTGTKSGPLNGDTDLISTILPSCPTWCNISPLSCLWVSDCNTHVPSLLPSWWIHLCFLLICLVWNCGLSSPYFTWNSFAVTLTDDKCELWWIVQISGSGVFVYLMSRPNFYPYNFASYNKQTDTHIHTPSVDVLWSAILRVTLVSLIMLNRPRSWGHKEGPNSDLRDCIKQGSKPVGVQGQILGPLQVWVDPWRAADRLILGQRGYLSSSPNSHWLIISIQKGVGFKTPGYMGTVCYTMVCILYVNKSQAGSLIMNN